MAYEAQRQGERPLPSFPRLGFGAGPIGNLYAPISDAQAFETVSAALAEGIGYFDTAPHYGFGLSESRLGVALAKLDPEEKTLVSTKVGRTLQPIAADAAGGVRHGFAEAAPFEPVFDYGRDAILRSFEDSRRRLGRRRIDLLLAHDIGRVTHGEDHERRFAEFMDGGYPAMRSLRDEGAVGAIGIGVNEWEVAEQALRAAEFDVILLAGRYTLLEQGALESFLPLCAARGVRVIIGGPYNSGVLARGAGGEPPARYNYETAPAEVLRRVERLEAVCARFEVPLAAAALQFPLAHPQVASVIPGLASAAEVKAAARLMALPIPDALWEALLHEGLLRPDAPTPRRPGPLILLSEADNVLVCAGPVAAGQVLEIDGERVTALDDVPTGHKIARRALKPGDKVLKYGAPIGSMTAPAARGAHVHAHNLTSDYIASHGRDAVGGKAD
ncbi:aldo/keto reductase [Phenylobacterium montanum]|uniref:aldo/keto reductase n=1 Tax=Phenylobacterium montanum TaxID=2823693 RepID=UPI0020139F23|nr:aldo/keto reductase [Caulobacter sp. S6]